MFQGCGCKICKNNLGENTNRLILDGSSPNEVINFLKENNLTVSKKLLSRHLSAFGIHMSEYEIKETTVLEAIEVDMNDFDFSRYSFDSNNPVSVIDYLQKLHLKIHLNQAEILLKLQQDVLEGKSIDVSTDALKNLLISWKIFNESSGIAIYANQQAAIKIVEAMGIKIEQYNSYILPSEE